MNKSAVASFTGKYILPTGFMIFLTALCLIESRSSYHTLLYLFLTLPTVIISLLKPALFKASLNSTALRVTFLLCAFATLSTAWNDPSIIDSRNIRYIINISLFVLSAAYIHYYQPNFIEKALYVAAAIWAILGLFEIYNFYIQQAQPLSARIVGSGSLKNTLLTSHVYGAFATFIISYYLFNRKQNRYPLIYLFILLGLLLFIVQTHSRTPLLGLVAVMACLIFSYRDKHTGYAVLAIIIAFIVYATLNYNLIISRGLSHRPEIWFIAIQKIQTMPIFGHGIGGDMSIFIKSLNTTFADSHNIHIGLTYYLGLTGLTIWLGLIAYLSKLYIQNKDDLLLATGFPMFIYGLFAGMTEGGNFFTRPKEVWFLVWLPIAILIAVDAHKHCIKVRSIRGQDG